MKLAPFDAESELDSDEAFWPDEHAVSARVATPATATNLVRVFMLYFLHIGCVHPEMDRCEDAMRPRMGTCITACENA